MAGILPPSHGRRGPTCRCPGVWVARHCGAESYSPDAVIPAAGLPHESLIGPVREHGAKLSAVVDVELAEHLAQVVLDRARAEEELGADLRVGVPVAHQPCDLDLLGRQGVARVIGDSGHGLASGEQLTASTLGERSGPHLAEAL